jgi:tRNA threonylcarbamoyladenosine biosynthesis protein TsaE
MVSEMEITYSLAEIPGICPDFWAQVSRCNIITFTGNMGAGKTTLIRELCAYLGTDVPASSPTFSLINEYGFVDGNGNMKRIYHIDLYRLSGVQEALDAGIEDCLAGALADGDFVFLEWPEKAAGIVGPVRVEVAIRTVDAATRHLTISKYGIS